MYQKPAAGWSLFDEEIEQLKSAKGGLEWEAVKLSIKEKRQGELPPDWFDQVIGSGLIANKIAEWNAGSFTCTEIEALHL